MCATSVIADHFGDELSRRYPWAPTQPGYPGLPVIPWPDNPSQIPEPTRPTKAEFEALKREVESIKELLKKAQKYDEDTGQPDCEKDEKVALLKRIAEVVGVDLADVLGG